MTRTFYSMILSLSLALTASAENLQQCTLSATRSGKLYGPFVLQDGHEIELDAARFYVKRGSGRQVSFVGAADAEIFGPFDVELGRMIRLGEQLYTLVDIADAPYQAPIARTRPTAPVVPPAAKVPEPAIVSPPILAPAAVKPPPARQAPPAAAAPPIAPAVKPAAKPARAPTPVVRAPKPASAPRAPTVATPRPAPKPAVTPPPRRNPAAAKSYASQQNAVRATPPPAWVAQKPTPAPYRAPAAPVAATAKPRRRTIQWERESPPRIKRNSLADAPMVGLDISFYEAVGYDRELSGSGTSSESSVSRNSAALTFRWLPVTVRAGLVLRSAWDDKLSGEGAAFQDIDLDGGSGWWGEIGLQYPVWIHGAWQLDIRGVGGVRKESYDLTYGTWQQTEITTTPEGTNLTEETVVLIRELANTTQAADFSETLFELGLTLSHGTDTWCAFSSLDLVAYQDAELDSAIEAGGTTYTIDLERSNPFILSLGGCFRRNNVNWFGELTLIGETAFRIGSSYTF